MKKEVLARLKRVFTGQVDIGERTHQSVVNEVFGIGEETALVPDYDDRTGETVGIREMVSRRFTLAESRGDFDSIGPEAFGRELMGKDYYHEVDRACEDPAFFRKIKAMLSRPHKIGESVQADTASLYEPINTWGSFVLGLFDHKILMGYDSAPRIFEKLIPTIPTMVHGAQKHTLHDYDGTLPSYEGLAELQEEDTARGAPYWVWSQQIKEFGLQYAITMEALKSDLDGGLGRRGEQIGIAMAKLENYRAGSTFMGYDNKFCANGKDMTKLTCNTFLSNADTGTGYSSTNPLANYVNKFYSSPLLTVDSLITAYVNMLQLQAPVTNWRLDVGNEFYLVVPPVLFARALQIIHNVRDYLAAYGGFSPSSTSGSNAGVGRVTESENVLALRNLNIEVVDMGIEWRDVLSGGMNAVNTQNITSNGPPSSWIDYLGNKANDSNANPLTQCTTETPYNMMSVTNTLCTSSTDSSGSADNCWFLLSKKGQYITRDLWIPVQPRTFLLAGTDMARRIGLRGDVIQASRFTTLEPRRAQLNLPHASGTQ
jgi:hypothetical protein